MTGTPSLEDGELAPFWGAVQARLERTDSDRRGRLRVPTLSDRGRYLLKGVMGGRVGATVDLATLEVRLSSLGVGADLSTALSALGHPVSPAPAERRAGRRRATTAKEAARRAVESWTEPWAEEWISAVIAAGLLAPLDAQAAAELVADTRRVLDSVTAAGGRGDRRSRTDLAATELGSAHALDWGTSAEGAVTRALTCMAAADGVTATGRAAWDHAGIDPDLVSAPVLTWRLPLVADSPLAGLSERSAVLGVPLHLTQLALRRHPVAVEANTRVLVVENPRVVEAAVQAASARCVISVNGNPTAAPLLLIDQLLDCGAHLDYHGDFDAAGLRICLRMHARGLRPWRMRVDDYLAALERADREGVGLPVDPHRSPPTPWDPTLQSAFDEHRRIVHEERDLASLIASDEGPVGHR